MRVVFATRNRALAGGLEIYVRSALEALSAISIETALLTELGEVFDRETIDAGIRMPVWCVDQLGRVKALSAIRHWRSDVICIHGLEDGALADKLIDLAPAVFFAHDYRGLCISGEKTHKTPRMTPCHREFGWECMLHYFPRRCGGLSPMTMWRDYSREMRERERLARFAAIVTTSEHVRAEYARAVAPERVHKIPMLVRKPAVVRAIGLDYARRERRLLFAGRMMALKGGHVLLAALSAVSHALGADLEVTMAGDGPLRKAWLTQANRVTADRTGIAIRFPGWLSQAELAQELARTDLLVMPSLWPEPFGLIGAEAARLGIPAAAFDVGGISEWLIDGISGVLAPADPPSASGLAHAIVRCLGDRETYLRLARGALENSSRFDPDLHVAALVDIFQHVASPTEDGRAKTA